MPRTLRPVYRDVSIPITRAGLMVGDMWCERPLRLEVVIRLLHGKAEPVR